MYNNKIIFLCNDINSVKPYYKNLSKDFEEIKIIREKSIDHKTLIKRRIKSLGLFVVIGQLAFSFIIRPALRFKAKNRIKELTDLMPTCDISADIILDVSSINDELTITYLQEYNPHVVVVLGTRIISRSVLSCIKAPFINVHTGITPRYRGVHGGYWAIAMKDRSNCGVTVHFVDEGIDTGMIISQAIIQPDEKLDNFETYPLLQKIASLPLVCKTVYEICNNTAKIIPPLVSDSKLWSHPTFFQYFKYLFNK